MWNSKFFEVLGCVTVIETTDENVDALAYDLTPVQCKVIQLSLLYFAVAGVVGCLLHGYIIFCYNFQVHQRMYTDTLIVNLSIFFCCCLLMAQFVICQFDIFEISEGPFICSYYFSILSLEKNSVNLVCLLLAANRYATLQSSLFHVFATFNVSDTASFVNRSEPT